MHESDRLALVRSNRVLISPPRSTPRLFIADLMHAEAIPNDQIYRRQVEVLEHQMLSYYQTARQLYLTRSYRSPAAVQVAGATAGDK